MKFPLAGMILAAAIVLSPALAQDQEKDKPAIPQFAVDPFWPKPLPNNWMLGQVSGIAVDRFDRIWVVHRPGTLNERELAAAQTPPAAKCCFAAPPVLVFDQSGNLLRSWGGPGPGYEWPQSEHGIFIDDNDFVWLAGNGKQDGQLLKFTMDGKLVLQIGKAGPIRGSNDTTALGSPADVAVDVAAKEVYAADGYTNRRVVVFDSETGAYKRHWGAYGNKPDDKASKARQATGAGPQQFNTPHGIEVSNDGIVYVTDRANNRVQSFTLDGKFLKEGFIKRESQGTGTAFGVALSTDPQQRFVYIADGSNERIAILDRKSLEEIGHIGGPGRKAGEFFHIHSLDVDPQGNIVTGESQGYRVQKFIYKGLSR